MTPYEQLWVLATQLEEVSDCAAKSSWEEVLGDPIVIQRLMKQVIIIHEGEDGMSMPTSEDES